MRAFWATAAMCVRQSGYFGPIELFSQYALRLLQMLAMAMIWRGLLQSGADAGDLTPAQLIEYTILSSALFPLLNVRTPASSWLHEGTMLSLYGRPSGIFFQLTAHTAGGWAMPMLLYALPVAALSAAAGLIGGPKSGWFFVSLPLAMAQGFAVDFLFACLIIRMRSLSWTVHSMREALSAVLTGGLIPFAAMPWGIGRFLSLTPLGTLAGAPLSLYAGLGDPAPLLAAQILWTATLLPLSSLAFSRARERMVSYGG